MDTIDQEINKKLCMEKEEKPSEDIVAALKVVEKLHVDDWICTISNNMEWADNKFWCEFVKRTTSNNCIVTGEADTLPLAICRAALKAINE